MMLSLLQMLPQLTMQQQTYSTVPYSKSCFVLVLSCVQQQPGVGLNRRMDEPGALLAVDSCQQ